MLHHPINISNTIEFTRSLFMILILNLWRTRWGPLLNGFEILSQLLRLEKTNAFFNEDNTLSHLNALAKSAR